MKEFYEELEGLKFKSFLFLSHQEMFTFIQASKNSILPSTAFSSVLGNGLCSTQSLSSAETYL